ncbi:hypothetical protein [Halomarina litorea]|uniref:hypothetical protein n=1 Tax=Halomarina litorea TaxID=2961595 RepID=UPI0020C3CC34|nr:hypothetical protein [Halomarina sp. BCD28]
MSDESDTPGADGTDELDTGDLQLRQGRQFHYEDGVAEAVVTVEGDRVLTVREYPSREAFRTRADGAVSVDVNEELADIDAGAVLDGQDGGASASAGAAAAGTEAVAPMGTEGPDGTDETDEE